jgi:hypothetical protein
MIKTQTLKFSSSFIQFWFCKNWDLERWLEEFQMLQKIGISEIILQTIADTKSHFTVYPTKIAGYTSNDIDMVARVLVAADRVGMKVRVGLGLNDEWWSVNSRDEEWLNHEAEANSEIATEIITRYDGHQSFVGWYIPHEFNPLIALNPYESFDLNQFYKKIAGTIKSKSARTIMVAPFYNARVSGPVSLTLWSNLVENTFKNTGIDIFALQDSIGAGFNTLDDLDEVYAYTKQAIDKIGLILYAVTETFDKTSDVFKPAQQDRIQEQMLRVSDYVSQFVAFSIDHYQNGNDPAQVKGYEDYSCYCLNLKKRINRASKSLD